MTTVPLYLAQPEVDGETYGTLRYRDGYYYIEDAVPAVREMAKRVFPGCGMYGPTLKFRATTRAVGDLNWLLLRYPMQIQDMGVFESDRQLAIEHALRRDANLHIPPTHPPASFTGTLRDYQAEGHSYLLANRRSLLADDMGLGKSVQAIAALATVREWPVLLVSPPNICLQWQRMVANFLTLPGYGGSDLTHVIRGRTPYDLPQCPVYMIHYGLLRNWVKPLREIRPQIVIFDEIQELRHTGTQKYSAASLLAQDAEYVWGLSGTPIYNYGDEIWSITNILDFNCLGDYESFTREWCEGYGTKIVSKPDVLGDHLRREGLMLRRRKVDVLPQLPPKRRIVQPVEHDAGTYHKLIAEAVGLAKSYDGMEWHSKGEAYRKIDTLSRQATGVSKAPAVADFVSMLIAAGERPLVYAWHHAVHDILWDLIPGRKARITGKQTPAEKDHAVSKFAAGELDVCLLSLRTAAGLDGLQEQATCAVFAELDWSPAVHSQLEDRIHRIGVSEDLDSVLCYYLVSETGYDGTVMDALGLKIGQFTSLMNDAVETEEDKAMAQVAMEQHMRKLIAILKDAA